MDYRLTDALADPLDTQQTFTEELVRLPGCFLCYTPPPEAPPVAPSPSALAGFVTFGSFNALAKMTPQVGPCDLHVHDFMYLSCFNEFLGIIRNWIDKCSDIFLC